MARPERFIRGPCQKPSRQDGNYPDLTRGFARHEKLRSLAVGGTTWVESLVLLRTHTISSSRGLSLFWAKALWLRGVDRHSNDYALGHKTRECHVRSKF